LIDDLGININDVAINIGLEDLPMLIILRHFQVGIEKSDKPGEDNTGACVEIRPLILLDGLLDAIQWRHHNVCTGHLPFSNDRSIHDPGMSLVHLYFCPLTDPALRTDVRHDSA
jgi:hypothetical protein